MSEIYWVKQLENQANNKINFKCCGESPFTTSSGCICLTDNQKEFIRSRGFNKNFNDI